MDVALKAVNEQSFRREQAEQEVQSLKFELQKQAALHESERKAQTKTEDSIASLKARLLQKDNHIQALQHRDPSYEGSFTSTVAGPQVATLGTIPPAQQGKIIVRGRSPTQHHLLGTATATLPPATLVQTATKPPRPSTQTPSPRGPPIDPLGLGHALGVKDSPGKTKKQSSGGDNPLDPSGGDGGNSGGGGGGDNQRSASSRDGGQSGHNARGSGHRGDPPLEQDPPGHDDGHDNADDHLEVHYGDDDDLQNLVVQSERVAKSREPDVIKIDPYLGPAKFREWKIHIHIRILAATGGTQRGMAWHLKIEASFCQDDLNDSNGFISLDFKLAAAMLTVVKRRKNTVHS